MSGRPSRNCKRRTAAEMLGKQDRSPRKGGTKPNAPKKIKIVEAVEDPQTLETVDLAELATQPVLLEGENQDSTVDAPETSVAAITSSGDIVEHRDVIDSHQTVVISCESEEVPQMSYTPEILEPESETVEERIIDTDAVEEVEETQTVEESNESVMEETEAIMHDTANVFIISQEDIEAQDQTDESQAEEINHTQMSEEEEAQTEELNPEQMVEEEEQARAEEMNHVQMSEEVETQAENMVSGSLVVDMTEVHQEPSEEEAGVEETHQVVMLDQSGNMIETTEEEISTALNPPKLITRTYIVGRDNSITSVVDSSSIHGVQHEESDDDCFELVDEELRIEGEGFDPDDDSIFDPQTIGTLISDETLIEILNQVKQVDTEEQHLAANEDGSIQEVLTYRCAYCDFVTATRRGFIRHLKALHSNEYAPWVCPLCTTFRSAYRASLAIHLNLHSTLRQYQCQSCDKRFAYRSRLEMHLRHHNDMLDYRCQACPKAFHLESALKIHVDEAHPPKIVIPSESEKSAIPRPIKIVTSMTPHSNVTVTNEPLSTKIQEQLNRNLSSSKEPVTIEMPSMHQKLSEGQEVQMLALDDLTAASSSGHSKGTISMVITLPQSETNPSMINPLNQYILKPESSKSRPKSDMVDKELLPYCEPLEHAVMFQGFKAILKCKVCPDSHQEFFGSITQFTDHLKSSHADQDIKPYECSQCDYKCRIKGNLEQHIKFHSTVRPFQCGICGKGFIQKYKLNLHMKFHENKREWKCNQCPSAFNDKQDLSRHMKNVHFDRETGVSCEHCDRVFKNDYMLSQHMHIHTGRKEYICDVCGNAYSTRESLRSHVKGHQFQFGCEICAKPLGSYSAFIAHKRLHDPGQKGFDCAVCGKNMLFKSSLDAHMKTAHTGEKPYPCDRCDKSFKTRGQLANHGVSHSLDKPYTCHLCGYSVKRKDSLRQHMFRHDDVKPFRCGRCGKEYTQKQALEIHLKSKHAGVTTFNCEHCDKGFNTNYQLKKHLQKHHNVEMPERLQPSSKVIIAQTTEAEVVEAMDEDGEVTSTKKQTILINAHICEHCQEVFVSQHALAVHILSDHMNDKLPGEAEDDEYDPSSSASLPPATAAISETIEIPIGEEMVVVQTAEPGVFTEALEQGATRISGNILNESTEEIRLSKPSTGQSLLNKSIIQVIPMGGEEERATEGDHDALPVQIVTVSTQEAKN